jgi:hypothetical protein
VRRRLAEPRLGLADGQRAAGRLCHRGDAVARGLRHRVGETGNAVGRQVPGPQRVVRHREALAQVQRQRGGDLLRRARGEQRQRQRVQLVGNAVVLLAELNQLRQLVFQHAHLVAHRDQLALAHRHRMGAVRMRDVQVRQQGGEVVEEIRVPRQVLGDVFGLHVH